MLNLRGGLGHLDLRLRPLIVIFLAQVWLGFLFTLGWFCLLLPMSSSISARPFPASDHDLSLSVGSPHSPFARIASSLGDRYRLITSGSVISDFFSAPATVGRFRASFLVRGLPLRVFVHS
jgi:hypothetical protein